MDTPAGPPSGSRAERLVSRSGAGLLVLAALGSYAVQALAWPLQRGRDSWDYWLTFLQLADRDPPFSPVSQNRLINHQQHQTECDE